MLKCSWFMGPHKQTRLISVYWSKMKGMNKWKWKPAIIYSRRVVNWSVIYCWFIDIWITLAGWRYYYVSKCKCTICALCAYIDTDLPLNVVIYKLKLPLASCFAQYKHTLYIWASIVERVYVYEHCMIELHTCYNLEIECK